MITLALGAAVIGTFGWFALRRPFLFFLLILSAVATTWRTVSVGYIDLAGPVYALELGREIGGGTSMVWFAATHLVVLWAIALVLREGRTRRLVAVAHASRASDHGERAIRNVAYLAFLAFAIVLYVDMARKGTIPVLQGIERFIYTEEYGGVAHAMLIKYGIFISFFLGMFYHGATIRTGHPDKRFLGAFLAILFYLFLAGHRYSSFYSHSSGFLMGYAAVLLAGRGAERSEGEAPAPRRAGTLGRLVWRAALVGGVATMIVYAVYVSLLVTRQFSADLVIDVLKERVLVQQGELWWSTYERVLVKHDADYAGAFAGVFSDPVVDPSRNTTLPYLMVRELGTQAYTTLDVGSSYTGGYPDILYELFPAGVALLVALGSGLLFAVLAYYLLQSVISGRYVRAFFTFYVLYPILLFPISGMLNTFYSWKYPVKVLALLAWMLVEETELLQLARRRAEGDGDVRLAQA